MKVNLKTILIWFVIVTFNLNLCYVPNVFATNVVDNSTILVTGITLNKTTDTLRINDTDTLVASVAPNNASNKNIKWTSSDDKVVTVDSNGKITAVASGNATITASAQDESKITAVCKVHVTKLADGIALNKGADSLVVGQADLLKVFIDPINSEIKDVTWKTSDPSTVSVDNSGNIKALKIGQALITATVNDGRNLHSDCRVNVTSLLSKKKKVDIVFTTGNDNSINAVDFNKAVDNYVKNPITNSGIDTNVESFSTSTVTSQTNFPWVAYNLYNTGTGSGDGQFRPIGNSYQYRGYGSEAPIDHLYYDDNTNNSRDFSFDIDMTGYNSCATVIPGFICGANDKNGRFTGYITFMWHDHIEVYYFNASGHRQFTSNGPGNIAVGASPSGFGGSRVASVATRNTSLQKSFRVVYSNKVIKIYDGGQLLTTVNCPSAVGNGFGIAAANSQHGCGIRSYTKFNNFRLTSASSKSFNDVIKESNWRDNTQKFVVNLSNDVVKEISSGSNNLPSILTTMLSNKEHFIGVMDNGAKDNVNNFIAKNDNKGTFIDNSNSLKISLMSVTKYILDQVNKEEDAGSNIFLAGDEINYHNYNNNDSDVLWSYTQDNKHLNYDNEFVKCSQNGDIALDNDLGISDFATGQWIKSKVGEFDKPGKYIIGCKMKDNSEIKETININRKPTPIFTAYAASNAQSGKFDITIKDEDKSYDIDHENSDGTRKGIANTKFQWKEITDGVVDSWHDGKLPSEEANNKDFLIKLQVQDIEGQWSDPLVKYVTTKSANVAPCAQFTESSGEMAVDQLNKNASANKDVIFTDESYDANGDNIREHWIVKDSSGNRIYDNTVMPTASTFVGKPLGTYTITLSCDDGPTPKVGTMLNSHTYSLKLKLVPINHKPIAHFSLKAISGSTPQIIEDSTDPDGDSIASRVWTVTDNSGKVVQEAENKLPNLAGLSGDYTITLKVKDNPSTPPELWSEPYSSKVTISSGTK